MVPANPKTPNGIALIFRGEERKLKPVFHFNAGFAIAPSSATRLTADAKRF
jgi:hypothetical protein